MTILTPPPSLQTIAAILPLLAALASPIGAGAVASLLIDLLRRRCPLPRTTAHLSHVYKIILWCLHAPLGARFTSTLLPILIAIICSALLAVCTGGEVWSAVDATTAALLAPIIANLVHGVQHLSRNLPTTPQLAGEIVIEPADYRGHRA